MSDTTADGLTMGALKAQGGQVFASCVDCGHERRMAPEKIAVGDDVEVASLGGRLKCSSCGSRRIHVSPVWED